MGNIQTPAFIWNCIYIVMGPVSDTHDKSICQRRIDRRQATLKSFVYAFFRRRRRSLRRDVDEHLPVYLDVHGPYVITAVIAIMLLCLADAFFTLELLKHGSEELNPLLAWALQKDVMWFYIIKYAITAICVMFLMMHKRFRFFGIKGTHLILGVIGSYTVLINYQLYMLFGLELL